MQYPRATGAVEVEKEAAAPASLFPYGVLCAFVPRSRPGAARSSDGSLRG